MIKTIYFFYYLFSYSTGIMALFFSLFLYVNGRNNLLKKYIFLSLSLFTIITLGIFLNYFNWNKNTIVIKNILSFISYSSTISIIFLFPNFTNDLFQIAHKKKIDLLFLLFAFLNILFLIILTFFKGYIFLLYFIFSSLGISLLYNSILTLFSFKKNQKQNFFYFMKYVAFLILFFFPAFVVTDFYQFIPLLTKMSLKGPMSMPLFYSILNILFILNTIKALLNKKEYILEISPVFINKYKVSNREKEVIELLLKGKSYKEIMDKLFISMPTVKTHVSNIYNKTNTNSKIELANLIKNES